MAYRWATEVFCSRPQSILVWKSRICTMSCLLIWFESLQKNRLNIGEDLFFWDHLILTEKPHQSNSRLMKIWIKFVDWCFKLPKKPPPPPPPPFAKSWLRRCSGSWKIAIEQYFANKTMENFSKWKWATVKKRLETTALNWCLFFHHFICYT